MTSSHNVFSDRRSRHPSCVLDISDDDHKHLFFICFFTSIVFSATNNDSLFDINVSNGVIALNGTLDREAVSEYKLRVLVRQIRLVVATKRWLPFTSYSN